MSAVLLLTHFLALVAGGILGTLCTGLCSCLKRSTEPDEWDEPIPVAEPLPMCKRRPSWSERTIDFAIVAGLALGSLVIGSAGVHAETAPAANAAPMNLTRTAPPAPSGDNTDQYCQAIADPARDARFTRQKAALEAMAKQIDERIARLEAKRAEYEQWLARREEFLHKADDAVIAVFSQMRPDAAAAQLTIMPDDPAAAILAKLNPRVASAILNEMDPARAARLTGVMVGIAKRTLPDGKSS